MTHQHCNRTAGTVDRMHGETDSGFDAFLIDNEFDDALDREIFAIRESLTDFRQA
jgi:hypothetical protein